MFNTNISFYSLAILLSLAINIVVVSIISKKYSYNKIELLSLLMYENTGIIIGAKVFTFIENFNQLNGDFDFINISLTSYGAVIGAILFLFLFAILFKKNIKELLYIFTPSIPLMYAIGKIGCFIVGCCHGIKYNGIFKVQYKYSPIAPNNTDLFPIQITETIVFLLIFIYMYRNTKNNNFNLNILGKSTVYCGISKFLLDFLRYSHTNVILSNNQLISIIIIIIGIILVKKK